MKQGRRVKVQMKIPNVLMPKYRYLNTTSNKKKLLEFNNNNDYSSLEELRLLYNNHVSSSNRRAEEHNQPIIQNNRKLKYLKNKELLKNTSKYEKEITVIPIDKEKYTTKEYKKLKRQQVYEQKKYFLKRKKEDAAKILQRNFAKIFTVRVDETAYKNYIKYVIPKAFHQDKYCRKKISTDKDSELECFYDKSVAKYYENQKSHIEDTKNNFVITAMTDHRYNQILQNAYDLIIIKLKKLSFKTMRIFVIMEFEVIYMKNKKIEIGINKCNFGRVDISSFYDFWEYFFSEAKFNLI